MRELNLGSGLKYKEGWVNLDNDKGLIADVYHDLNVFPWPFEDDEFDHVYGRYVLEHLDNTEAVISEIERITKPGGTIELIVPYETSNSAWGHIQHRRGFNTTTLDYDAELNFPKGFYAVPSWFFSMLFRKRHRFYENTVLRFLYPAYSIVFRKVKDMEEKNDK